MSFKLGDFDTAEEAGLLATLKAWPAPVLTPEAVDALDGEFYARTRREPLVFEFDLILKAQTPAGVLAIRDRLVDACAPHRGLQALTPEAGEGWIWWASARFGGDFTRGLWVNGLECQLRSSVAFRVPDGLGWAAPDDTAAGTTSANINRRGNAPSFPRLTLEGDFEAVRVTAGGSSVDVAVPVTPGRRLVLDYQGQDFGVWAGAVKVAHAAGGMSHFDRLTLPVGPSTITAAPLGGGTVSALSVAANSRRL